MPRWRDLLDAFEAALPITHGVMRQMSDLIERYPLRAARGLVNVATCLGEGIEATVSPDRGFDDVREIRPFDPAEVAG